MKKVLFVLTSHAELGDTGEKTGFWLEEAVSPFYEFADRGFEITLASPKGGGMTNRSDTAFLHGRRNTSAVQANADFVGSESRRLQRNFSARRTRTDVGFGNK